MSKFVVAFDDAYYSKRHTNDSYINMLRSKLKLKKIEEPKNNICKPIYVEIQNYLKSKYKKVKNFDGSYKAYLKNDIFFKYFLTDRKFAFKMGMEQQNQQEKYFAAFSVENK